LAVAVQSPERKKDIFGVLGIDADSVVGNGNLAPRHVTSGI
jgi:hypothetical protein